MMGAILSAVLLLAIGVWVVFALRHRKKHRCSGDCSHCSGCS